MTLAQGETAPNASVFRSHVTAKLRICCTRKPHLSALQDADSHADSAAILPGSVPTCLLKMEAHEAVLPGGIASNSILLPLWGKISPHMPIFQEVHWSQTRKGCRKIGVPACIMEWRHHVFLLQPFLSLTPQCLLKKCAGQFHLPCLPVSGRRHEGSNPAESWQVHVFLPHVYLWYFHISFF